MINAARVLALASAYDDRKPDPTAAAAWQKLLEPAGLTQVLLEDAVAQHYSEETRRIMPADVIRRAKAIRAEEAHRRALPSGYEDGPSTPEGREEAMRLFRALCERTKVPADQPPHPDPVRGSTGHSGAGNGGVE
ncbi:MAG: hypothetical protein NVSMB4_05980 [Acidimicrobiales bacterium]